MTGDPKPTTPGGPQQPAAAPSDEVRGSTPENTRDPRPPAPQPLPADSAIESLPRAAQIIEWLRRIVSQNAGFAMLTDGQTEYLNTLAGERVPTSEQVNSADVDSLISLIALQHRSYFEASFNSWRSARREAVSSITDDQLFREFVKACLNRFVDILQKRATFVSQEQTVPEERAPVHLDLFLNIQGLQTVAGAPEFTTNVTLKTDSSGRVTYFKAEHIAREKKYQKYNATVEYNPSVKYDSRYLEGVVSQLDVLLGHLGRPGSSTDPAQVAYFERLKKQVQSRIAGERGTSVDFIHLKAALIENFSDEPKVSFDNLDLDLTGGAGDGYFLVDVNARQVILVPKGDRAESADVDNFLEAAKSRDPGAEDFCATPESLALRLNVVAGHKLVSLERNTGPRTDLTPTRIRLMDINQNGLGNVATMHTSAQSAGQERLERTIDPSESSDPSSPHFYRKNLRDTLEEASGPGGEGIASGYLRQGLEVLDYIEDDELPRWYIGLTRAYALAMASEMVLGSTVLSDLSRAGILDPDHDFDSDLGGDQRNRFLEIFYNKLNKGLAMVYKISPQMEQRLVDIVSNLARSESFAEGGLDVKKLYFIFVTSVSIVLLEQRGVIKKDMSSPRSRSEPVPGSEEPKPVTGATTEVVPPERQPVDDTLRSPEDNKDVKKLLMSIERMPYGMVEEIDLTGGEVSLVGREYEYVIWHNGKLLAIKDSRGSFVDSDNIYLQLRYASENRINGFFALRPQVDMIRIAEETGIYAVPGRDKNGLIIQVIFTTDSLKAQEEIYKSTIGVIANAGYKFNLQSDGSLAGNTTHPVGRIFKHTAGQFTTPDSIRGWDKYMNSVNNLLTGTLEELKGQGWEVSIEKPRAGMSKNQGDGLVEYIQTAALDVLNVCSVLINPDGLNNSSNPDDPDIFFENMGIKIGANLKKQLNMPDNDIEDVTDIADELRRLDIIHTPDHVATAYNVFLTALIIHYLKKSGMLTLTKG
jgi:hypothetical protein